VARKVGLVGFLKPTTYLRRHAVTKGVMGGSKGWVVLAVLLWSPRLTKRVLGRSEQVVAREKLKSGQFVSIEALGSLPKAERKAIVKANKRAR
jgi:hypothetical protein